MGDQLESTSGQGGVAPPKLSFPEYPAKMLNKNVIVNFSDVNYRNVQGFKNIPTTQHSHN